MAIISERKIGARRASGLRVRAGPYDVATAMLAGFGLLATLAALWAGWM